MVRDLIWNDFVHAKFGDEYLCLYLRRQKLIRKIFKICAVVFSGSGILTTLFQPYKLPTVILLALIALTQLATSIENFIIHSEDDLDKLSSLRLLYYEHANELEKLWLSVYYDDHNERTASEALFTLRRSASKIEELDNKLNIRTFKQLVDDAYYKSSTYINSNYGQVSSTTPAAS